MNDSTRDAALRALADPTTPAAVLMQVVSEHPDLGWQAARHPNAYPDLVDWVRRYAPAPDGAAAPEETATPDAPDAAESTASAPEAFPSDYPMHPTTPAPPRKKRGLLIALIVVLAVLVLAVGGLIASTLWLAATGPTTSGPDSGASETSDPEHSDGGAGEATDGDAGTTDDGTDGSAAPSPDERTDELEAAAKRNGFPVELQGTWCPDGSEDPEECFSIDDWAAENPDGFVYDVGPANAYFERPGATGIQLCLAPDAGEGACSTAASMALTYYPAGVETRICDQPFVTEGYEGCEPGYEYDTTRDRLMIEANHQQDTVFHEAVPLYRR